MPGSSAKADPSLKTMRSRTLRRSVCLVSTLLSSGTGCWIPARRVTKLLEVRGGDVGPAEIQGILDFGGNSQPMIAVRQRIEVVVLGHDGLTAVWRAVFPHVPSAQIGRYDFQIAAAHCTASSSSVLPLGDRTTLPAGLSG